MNIRSVVFLFVHFCVQSRMHRRKLISMMMRVGHIEKQIKSSMPSISSFWSSIKTMLTSQPGYARRNAHGVRNTVRSTQCAVVWSKPHWLTTVLSSFRVGSPRKKVTCAEAAGKYIQQVHPAGVFAFASRGGFTHELEVTT